VKKLSTISLGIALFTMFFGGGNIIFPLILGREVQGNILPALAGFITTAVIVPIIGFLSSMLYEGDYEKLFSNINKIPAKLTIFFCIAVSGVLSASRCVVLSYAAIEQYIPNASLFKYSILVSIIIFIATFRENTVVRLLGKFLGPVKIFLLISILFLVFFNLKEIEPSHILPIKSFFEGFVDGYFIFDLASGLFFSHLIFRSMEVKHLTLKQLIKKGLKIGLICGFLLTIIYTGFGIVAAIFSNNISNVPNEKIFAVLSGMILGNTGAVLANMAVAIATLTTAMSLITIFADYICYDILKGKFNYSFILIFIILFDLIFENLNFSGIMKIQAPISCLIYPALIALSTTCILKKLFGFKYIKSITYTTFAITCIAYIFLLLK
jgi:branched-chain amino acid:cation transporter, LIVCS family